MVIFSNFILIYFKASKGKGSKTNQEVSKFNFVYNSFGCLCFYELIKQEWATINADLTNILGRLRGTVDKKLEKMGDLIYSYGAERFGLKQPRKKETPTPPKSRRQREIK